MGRPAKPKGTALEATIGVSVTVAERAEYHEAARRLEMTLADLVRTSLDDYLRKHDK
jgi:hypothetical protein